MNKPDDAFIDEQYEKLKKYMVSIPDTIMQIFEEKDIRLVTGYLILKIMIQSMESDDPMLLKAFEKSNFGKTIKDKMDEIVEGLDEEEGK